MSDFVDCGSAIAGFAVPPRQREAGSAIVFVMLTVSVLSVVAASLLLTNVTRYQTISQSAQWQGSIVAAEAGVDLAMNELRRRVVTGPSVSFCTGWMTTNPTTSKTYGSYGHAFPASSKGAPYDLPVTSGAEGNPTMQVRVYVDVPGSDAAPSNFAQANNTSFISQLDNPNLRDADGIDRSRWLFRIRSLGTVGIGGPTRPGLDKRDNVLRRISFFADWRTGRAVAAPQASRLVEVIARPQTNFRNALMADKQINLSNQDVLIDSYDSGKGSYDSKTNHGQMGNLATNGQLINANHATVNGNAMTNNGSVDAGDKVSGQQSSTFYQELTPLTTNMLNPAWGSVKDGGTVNTGATYTASVDASNPTLVHLDGINLSADGNIINVNPPDGTVASTPSYIKFYVQGDITTGGTSFINVASGVNAIIYFSGNLSLQGLGLFNNSMLASHLVLNGIQPPANADGTFPARTISIATTQDFEGIVYAPNHDVKLALQAAATTTGSSASQQLSQLQTDQNQAVSGWNSALSTYQNAVRAAGGTPPNPTLVVATTASDLSAYPAPNSQSKSALANLQAALNKVAQTEIQIENLKGMLTSSQQDDHARGYNGIYGGFVARTITVAAKTHVHYDETLRTAGPVNGYQIINWFEDTLSRNAVGGAERFWW